MIVTIKTVKDLCDSLQEWAPLSYQEKYDNSGLLTGSSSDDIKGVLVTLDCTEQVVEEAILLGCNVIIAHHPIIFSGLKSITGKNYVERTIILAIKYQIAIYAIHTNLDNVIDGVNSKIVQRLGLKNVSVLLPKNDQTMLKKLVTYCPTEASEKVKQALFDAGAGSIGNYDECSFSSSGTGTFRPLEGSEPYLGKMGERESAQEEKIELVFLPHFQNAIVHALKVAHPYEEVAFQIVSTDNTLPQVGGGIIGELEKEMDEKDFLVFLKSAMNTACVRYSPLRGKSIKKVAACGGSGSFLLKNAIYAGADVFVTGDFKYHQFFDSENRIIIADIGHYESEQYTKELIFEYLNKKSIKFALHLSKVNTNPVNYL